LSNVGSYNKGAERNFFKTYKYLIKLKQEEI